MLIKEGKNQMSNKLTGPWVAGEDLDPGDLVHISLDGIVTKLSEERTAPQDPYNTTKRLEKKVEETIDNTAGHVAGDVMEVFKSSEFKAYILKIVQDDLEFGVALQGRIKRLFGPSPSIDDQS